MILRFALAGACAGILCGCLERNVNTIQVDGAGVVRAAPDEFTIEATIRTEGVSRETALAGTAQTLARIKQDLPNLEGLQRLNIDASKASVSPVRDPECLRKADYDSECPYVGYEAGVPLELVGSPAEKAGAAFALLVESGVQDASVGDYRISDEEQRKKDALKAAVADARAKAETIAGGAGAAVKRVRRVQYGRDFEEFSRLQDELIVVTGSRLTSPKTALELAPQPIVIRAEVVAEFEIE